MATYNFTVRATDNAGAFADRTFSMNVNDTTATSTYDRFLAISSAGTSRSADGINWSSSDPLTSGLNRVVYGNGIWVAFNTTSQQYRWAPASTMAWSPLYSLSSIVDSATTNQGSLAMDIRFRKGKWILITGYVSGAQLWIIEATATDITAGLSGWAYTRTVASFTSGGTSNIPNCSFDYDPVSDTWVTLASQPGTTNAFLYRRQGSGAWTKLIQPAMNQFNNATFGPGNVRFTNGLWLISAYADSGFFTSTDGATFVLRNVTGTTVTGIAPIYQNGRILAIPISNASTGTALQVRESTNGGRSFVARGPAATNFPQSYQSTANSFGAPRQVIATSGTTTIWGGYSPQGKVQVSTDDFLTSTQVIVPDSTTIYAVAARDS